MGATGRSCHDKLTGWKGLTAHANIFVIHGDGLSRTHFRALATNFIEELRRGRRVEVISASTTLFDAALTLYRQRPDKDWGLTDCASFVLMRDRGLTDALATDEHFRQAGFRPLLLDADPASVGP